MAKKNHRVGTIGTLTYDDKTKELFYTQFKHWVGSAETADGQHLYVSISPKAHSDEVELFGRFLKIMRRGANTKASAEEIKDLWHKFGDFLGKVREWEKHDKCVGYNDIAAQGFPVTCGTE